VRKDFSEIKRESLRKRILYKTQDGYSQINILRLLSEQSLHEGSELTSPENQILENCFYSV